LSASTKRRTRNRTVEHPDTADAPRPYGLHVKVDRAALVAALTEAKAVIPARAAAPVLAGVHLRADAEAGTLHLAAFDYDLSVRIRLEAAVTGSGTLLLPGRDLYDLVKKTAGATVEIRAVGSKAVVKPGSTEFTVQTLPVEDYPALPDMPAGGGTVFVQQFLDAVKQVTVAAGIDDTIPMLTGVRIEFHGDTMALVATDRFRLAVAEIPWFPDEPLADRPPLLIPAKILKGIVSRWDKATGRLRIGLGQDGPGDGLAGFALEAETYTTRLMSGEFVKYRSLFPAQYARTVVAETTVLHAAAGRIALVAGRSSPITLTAFPGAVVLEAGDGDDARGLEVVPALFDGAPFSVSCNPYFLLDALAALGQRFASLNITTPTKPLVLAGHRSPATDGDSGYRYLMMPLRVPTSSRQDRHQPGSTMDLGQAMAYMADHGTVCKTTALAAATVAAAEATAVMDLLETPDGFADRPGAALIRNVINESAAFTAWAAASEPTCPAGVCELCDSAGRTGQPQNAGRR
jgi:DNA polymerase III subunit beta